MSCPLKCLILIRTVIIIYNEKKTRIVFYFLKEIQNPTVALVYGTKFLGGTTLR